MDATARQEEVANTVVRLTIPGRPVPAVRMTRRGKFFKLRPRQYLAYKDQVGWVAREYMVRHGIPKFGRRTKLRVEIMVYVCGKPGDVDNYMKSLLDGLNGVLWDDDCQVRRGEVEIVEVASRNEQRAEVVVEVWNPELRSHLWRQGQHGNGNPPAPAEG